MGMTPGYRQTEVGVIPEDWGVARLGDLFEITSSKRVFQSEWRTDGVPFYRAREIAVLGETGHIDNDLFISRQMYDAFRLAHGVPQVGDLLVTGVGTLGKVYVVPDRSEFYFKDGNIIWFKVSGAVDPTYLWQLYLTPVVSKQIADTSGGTTVGTYTISGAKNTLIPLPAKAEQEAIADALRDADALVESLEHLVAKKRHLVQGAMQELLTAKRRLPGFSGEWGTKRLGSVLRFQVGFPFRSAFFNEQGQGIRLVKNRDLKSDDQPSWYSGTFGQEYLVRDGDVLVGMDGDFSVCLWSKGPALLNQRVGRVVPLSGLDRVFAFYCLGEPLHQIENATSSTTVKHLSHGDVEGIEKALPSPEEQSAIAAILSDMDAEITTLESRLAKSRQIKQGMMQQLLTGKIRLV